MSYPLPDFLVEFLARTSLETPQINLEWALDTSETVTLERLRIMRSTTRYPVDETDGSLVQEWTSNIPTKYSESAPLTADEFYYYSAFGRYELPIRSTSVFDHDIRRVFTEVLGVYDSLTANYFWVVGRGADGYIRATLDGERGYVTEVEALEGVGAGVNACIGVGTFAGETTTFFCDNQSIYGVTSAGKAIQVDFQYYGGDIVGGYIQLAAGAIVGFGLLDTAANDLVVFGATGAVVSTTDYSVYGSEWTGFIASSGLAFYILSQPGVAGVAGSRVKVLSTAVNGQVSTSYSDIPPGAGIGFVTYAGSGVILVTDPADSGRFKGFDFFGLTDTFLTEQPDVDINTVLLYHADSSPAPGVLPDAAYGAFDGALQGAAVVIPIGKFQGSLDLTGGPGSYVLIPPPFGVLFLPGTGTESFWFKADLAVWVDPNPYGLWTAANSLGPEYITLTKVPGLGLELKVFDGIVSGSAVAPMPTDGEWHHALMVRDIVGGTISLQIDDGPPILTVTPVAVVAPLDVFYWGADPTAAITFPGYLDEFRAVTDVRPAMYVDEHVYIRSGTSDAWSGGDRVVDACYRDIAAKEGFIPGEILATDATNKVSSGNYVTSTLEILRRGWPEHEVGHTARLHRLIGLFFDQLADLRRYWFPADVDKCGEDVLGLLMKFMGDVGPGDVVDPRTGQQYSIDRVRKYLHLLGWIAPRVGISEALEAVVHFYQCRTVYSVTQPRRHFDSGIPFDSGMPLDSWDAIVAEVLINAGFWDNIAVVDEQTDGATTVVPGLKQISSVLGDFSDVRAGDMVRLLDSPDLGDRVVDSVVNPVGPAVLDVTEDWPVGNQAGVAFKVIQRVPNEDPISEYVREQMKSFSVSFVNVLGD